jgi:Asp-tRNA(Asn)/Glu-tRNA(Gln) amidotransferase A subunit family amidase
VNAGARDGGADPEALAWTPATALAELIRSKVVSSEEVVEALLLRIERLNPALNAYCAVTADDARQAARAADAAVARGDRLGRLHGVPVSVKDTIFTRGLRTTAGSQLCSAFVPAEDAAAVSRLRQAGAIVIGKTNTPEFAHKGLTDNRLFGPSRNPWRLECTPGGSSGGAAAAVAAGLAPIGLGTDEGGSIRIPAAFCGVYGLKPSFGRVPTRPGFPGWDSLGTVGPITRTVRDAALVLDVIADRELPDGNSRSGDRPFTAACDEPVGDRMIGWTVNAGGSPVEPTVSQTCADAVATLVALGYRVEPVAVPWGNAEATFSLLIAAEASANWGHYLADSRRSMDATLVRLLEHGATLLARDYVRALRDRQSLQERVNQLFRRVDLLVTPTVAVTAFEDGWFGPRTVAGQPVSSLGWMPFTYLFNLTGHPAASVPAGFTADDLPVGLQIVGRTGDEPAVLALSAALEAARPWAARRPDAGRPPATPGR